MTNRVRSATPCLVALALLIGVARGDDPPATDEAICRWAEQAPKVDGKLVDPAWTAASVIDRFPTFWKKTDPGPAHATRARLVWDRDALYFAAELTDAEIRAFGTRQNDHLWNGDVFELFFKPSRERPEYFEFQVNPESVRFEAAFLAKNQPTVPFDARKSLGMSAVAVARIAPDRPDEASQGWTVEGRIPWTAFGPTFARPEPGASWTFALCRYDYSGPEKSEPIQMSSAPLTRPDFHRSEDYGRLQFQGRPDR